MFGTKNVLFAFLELEIENNVVIYEISFVEFD